MMTLQQTLTFGSEEDLSRDATREVMTAVMTGEASNAQIGALLVALHMKGEAIGEIAGAAEVAGARTPVDVSGDDVIDLVGTGGDGCESVQCIDRGDSHCCAAGALV